MYGYYQSPPLTEEEQLRQKNEQLRQKKEMQKMRAEEKLIKKAWKDIDNFNKLVKDGVIDNTGDYEDKSVNPLTDIGVVEDDEWTGLTPKEMKEIVKKQTDPNDPDNRTKPITIMNIRRDIVKTHDKLVSSYTRWYHKMTPQKRKKMLEKIKRLELMNEIFSGDIAVTKEPDYQQRIKNINKSHFTGGKTKKRRRKKRKKRKTKKKRRRKKKTRKRGGMPRRPKPPEGLFNYPTATQKPHHGNNEGVIPYSEGHRRVDWNEESFTGVFKEYVW